MTEAGEFGPKMRALTEKQRAFVLAVIEHPGIGQGRAAELAGYRNSPGGYRVTGHLLIHNEKVIAAINEVAGQRLRSNSLLAAGVLIEIMTDEGTARKDRLKAALALLDRTGHAAAQNININQNITDQSGKAIMERIRALANKHGLDPTKLLGPARAAPIDAEYSEVKDG